MITVRRNNQVKFSLTILDFKQVITRCQHVEQILILKGVEAPLFVNTFANWVQIGMRYMSQSWQSHLVCIKMTIKATSGKDRRTLMSLEWEILIPTIHQYFQKWLSGTVSLIGNISSLQGFNIFGMFLKCVQRAFHCCRSRHSFQGASFRSLGTKPQTYVREEPAVGCRWTGWVREITSSGSRLQQIYCSF